MEHICTKHRLQMVKVDHGSYKILPSSGAKSNPQPQTKTSPPATPQSANSMTPQVREQQFNHPEPNFAILDATPCATSITIELTPEPISRTNNQPDVTHAQLDDDVQDLLEARLEQEIELMLDQLQLTTHVIRLV